MKLGTRMLSVAAIAMLACVGQPLAAQADPGTPTGDHHDHADHDHGHMPDWTGWKPTAHDTCSLEVHEKANVIGPDGLPYTSWHPAKGPDGCTFGHEHGDDPRTSKIYDWVRDKLAANGHESEAGLPFGFVSHASAVYAEAGGGVAHRHEDHPGHKVFVLNDVRLVHADRSKGYVRDSSGKPVVCHYLMKMHQGSHSPDATRNNAHELIYAMRCSDGAEAVVSTLTKLGNPNEFHANCDEQPVATEGSDLPGNKEGRRLIPTSQCVKAHHDVWGTYETWETDTRIEAPDGHTLIHFDPWFGVRNPSRIWDSQAKAAMATVDMGERLGESAGDGVPWYRLGTGITKDAPTSPFNGAKRDVYVKDTLIDNAAGPTTWYTDPYGGHASTTPFPGSVRQYVSAVTTPQRDVGRAVFGWTTDYGPEGSGVHAPN